MVVLAAAAAIGALLRADSGLKVQTA